MNSKAITMAFKLCGYDAIYEYMEEFKDDKEVIDICSKFFDIKVNKINTHADVCKSKFNYDTLNIVLGGAMYDRLNYFFVDLRDGATAEKITFRIYYTRDWDSECKKFKNFFWNSDERIIPYAIIKNHLNEILRFSKEHDIFDTEKIKYISFNYGKYEVLDRDDAKLILTLDDFNNPDLDLTYLKVY